MSNQSRAIPQNLDSFYAFRANLENMLVLARADMPVLAINAGRNRFDNFKQRIRTVSCLITDFDGTLTSEGQIEPLRRVMTPAEQSADQAQSLIWYMDVVNEIVFTQLIFATANRLRGRLTLDKTVKIASSLPFRPGARELLGYFAGKDGVFVVSSGYKDVIERAVMAAIRGSSGRIEVAAAELKWNRNGLCCACDENTIVTEATKGEKAKELGARPDSALVLGDEPRGDHELFRLGGLNVLLFSVNDNHRERVARRTAALNEEVWNSLDAVLIGDSLWPLANLLPLL